MTDIAIRVENLGKRYQIGASKSGSFRESLSHLFRRDTGKRRPETGEKDTSSVLRSPSSGVRLPVSVSDFWALQDINFEIKRGEAVGIIGRNGAGKSTLLKILSRITEPTKGRFEIFGRVSSLLEVGTGFHPELTGRENVYLNGTILGMKRREVKAKFDEIVAFSGVEKFIDTPVKHYSSGMQVRLAFAVAAHLEPEILIIDEVLAVGDAEFQKKCLGKMEDVTGEGRTVLFVSHNMGAVQSLCDRGIWIKSGAVEEVGTANSIIARYLSGQNDNSKNLALRSDRVGNGQIRLDKISLYSDLNASALDSVLAGSDVSFKVDYKNVNYKSKSIKDLHLGLAVQNAHQQFVTVLNNKMSNYVYQDVPSCGSLVCRVPKLPLMSGNFIVTATLVIDGEVSDKIENAFSFSVSPSDFYESGLPNVHGRQGVYINQTWELITNYERKNVIA